jgi:hypothetical protein
MSRAQTYPTVEEIRAAVEAGKRQAMIKFEADWGTRDVGKVMMALRHAIPGSDSPAHAAQIARNSLSA